VTSWKHAAGCVAQDARIGWLRDGLRPVGRAAKGDPSIGPNKAATQPSARFPELRRTALATAPVQNASQDYVVRDIALADYGRAEIAIAETEMPGLMALR